MYSAPALGPGPITIYRFELLHFYNPCKDCAVSCDTHHHATLTIEHTFDTVSADWGVYAVAYMTVTITDDIITIVADGEPSADDWETACRDVLHEQVTIADYRTDGTRHAWRLLRENATCLW